MKIYLICIRLTDMLMMGVRRSVCISIGITEGIDIGGKVESGYAVEVVGKVAGRVGSRYFIIFGEYVKVQVNEIIG